MTQAEPKPEDVLFDLLACPKCHGELQRVSAPLGFACGRCALLYAIEDGLPNMLIDDAQPWPVGR